MINIEGDTASIVFTIKQPTLVAGVVTGYTLVDPTTLTVAVISPTPTTTTYVYNVSSALTRVEAGVFRLVIPVAVAGEWVLQIRATAPGVYDEQSFMVSESQVWDLVPPLSDYELFTGASATVGSAMALDQAQLLLQMATGVDAQPTGRTNLRVYRFAIFAMAEALEANQGTRSISMSPFRVEEIGSYRYERGRSDIHRGLPTGIMWFDLGVEHFNGLGGSTLGAMHSSIGLFEFEDNMRFIDSAGRSQILGPGDIAAHRVDQYQLLRVYGAQIGPD